MRFGLVFVIATICVLVMMFWFSCSFQEVAEQTMYGWVHNTSNQNIYFISLTGDTLATIAPGDSLRVNFPPGPPPLVF